MSTLASIPVAVEHASGNIEPLLHEIGHALERLLAGGPAAAIDLRSVPLAPGEEGRILDFLGKGEVRAELEAGGTSTVQETRFAGVWVVTHLDPEGEIIGRFIEICFIPDIVRSQLAEMRDSRERLARDVALMRQPAARRTTRNTDGDGAVKVLQEPGPAGPA